MIISIDGPAGSGKSTVAELLSKKLKYIHFNSGSLYRGVTAYLVDKKIDYKTITLEQIKSINLSTKIVRGLQHVYVNGKDYTSHLRDNEISILCAQIGLNPEIRKIIDNCQRDFAKTHNIVIEGRDIGSFVFPNADYKFYLDCDVKERALRRFKEEQLKNSKISLKEIETQIIARDKLDKERKIAPLCVPKNAIMLDSTNSTPDQIADLIKFYITPLS